MNLKTKRLCIRLIAILLLLLLAVWMYFLGRRHIILVDNKKIEDLGIKAYDLITVQVDDQEPIELTKRGRDQFVVMGQKHTLTMKWTDKNWIEQERSWKISIPVGWDMALVSLPYLGNNPDAKQEEWITQFVVQTTQNSDVSDSQIDTSDSFAM